MFLLNVRLLPGTFGTQFLAHPEMIILPELLEVILFSGLKEMIESEEQRDLIVLWEVREGIDWMVMIKMMCF